MTGFARINVQIETAHIVWEARSVNHKSLDIKLRANIALDEIENILKKQVSQYFTRGSIGLSLSVSFHNNFHAPKVNEVYLQHLLDISQKLQVDYGLQKPTITGLLALDGVLEKNQNNNAMLEDEVLKQTILSSFEDLMQKLQSARQLEGENLQKILVNQVNSIDTLNQDARNDPARSLEYMQASLEKSVTALMQTNMPFDTQRLHMEAALLATKADIQEEIDRLEGHVAAARQLLQTKEPVGRRLDFLAQEFNREANTLCSKANTTSLSKTGLALKAVIDQFREQIQNIE